MLEAKSSDIADSGAGYARPAIDTSGRGAKKPVCIVLHQEHSNPGHVGQWFARNAHRLDIRKPRFGDSLPATLENHCGAVVFGGPMSANDKDDFVRAEIDWLRVVLAEKKPYLGICLGAQMLAIQLGAKVDFDKEERAEIGYYPLLTTADGLRLGPFPDHVYQWHREGCELPRGCRLLATSPGAFPVQAFGCGAAVGVQFHPEITYAQVHRWSGHNPTRLTMKGARARQEHIDGHIVHGPKVQAWLDQFLGRWVAAELTIG
jgi:GMP synthase (glutamine-hydrolysing)